jgi:hypothetical protein
VWGGTPRPNPNRASRLKPLATLTHRTNAGVLGKSGPIFYDFPLAPGCFLDMIPTTITKRVVAGDSTWTMAALLLRPTMSERLRVAFLVTDAAGIPIFIGWYIWQGQFIDRRIVVFALVWLILSFLIHRDTPKSLGMRGDNLWPATKQAAIVFGVFAILLFVAGIALRQPLLSPPNYRSFGRLSNYLAFCLFQQVALNSLLMNRLLSLIRSRRIAGAIAGAVFSALHWPNPVLVPVTLVGGTAMAWMFARERNILPLAVGQALLGSLVWWAFPIAWHHMMRVGPGYYSPY